MTLTVYGLPTCDTCRTAMKQLDRAGRAAVLVDVRTTGVPDDVLTAALDRFGAALVNRRSTTWRGLTDAERQAAPRELLKAHPTLMKRPLIDAGRDLHLGWTDEVRAAAL